jgi:hypothetical protein
MFQRLSALVTRKREPPQRHGWYPPALRSWNLSFAIVICWLFIAILQYHLIRSQRDGGVLFAPNINNLPLSRTFAYRYLLTVIAVIFSIYVVWIDNDARRYEPYRQMSKPGGALAKNSILLHYPFDFLPLVPFKSLKRRQVYIRSWEIPWVRH